MPSYFVRLQICISILTLLYVILAYYGYVRYIKLRTRSCESFAKEYLTLPGHKTNHKVIVSMATDVDNLDQIKTAVNSILDQTVHPTQIIISSCKENLSLPKFIEDNHIIIVHATQPCYGEAANFISPLLREKDADAIIILVDDHGIYGNDFLETIIDASDQQPNGVVYISGYNAKASIHSKYKVSSDKKDDVISVPDGVLIKPKFFDETIFDIPRDLYDNPDLYLSLYLQKHNIPRYKINYNENLKKFKNIRPQTDKLISRYSPSLPSFKD